MLKKLQIKNTLYDADYAGVGYNAWLKAQIYDSRQLSLVAPDVENAEEIILTDGEKTEAFEGYTKLVQIQRVNDEVVMFMLEKPEIIEV